METQGGYKQWGTWKNIPLFFHWTVLLWLPWYAFQGRSLAWIALSFPAYTVLLLAHEIGHAMAARNRRAKVASIRLYLLHGLCEHEEPHYESDHIFIAWAGVLAQCAVLLLALAAQWLTARLAPMVHDFLQPIFYVFINANCVIAVINLIPVQPLDGYIAWRVIPWFRNQHLPDILKVFGTGFSRFNLKKRRDLAKESERLTAELLDRLKNK